MLKVTVFLDRWKGENVSTAEVADVLTFLSCIQEAAVYGVQVPGKPSPQDQHVMNITLKSIHNIELFC